MMSHQPPAHRPLRPQTAIHRAPVASPAALTAASTAASPSSSTTNNNAFITPHPPSQSTRPKSALTITSSRQTQQQVQQQQQKEQQQAALREFNQTIASQLLEKEKQQQQQQILNNSTVNGWTSSNNTSNSNSTTTTLQERTSKRPHTASSTYRASTASTTARVNHTNGSITQSASPSPTQIEQRQAQSHRINNGGNPFYKRPSSAVMTNSFARTNQNQVQRPQPHHQHQQLQQYHPSSLPFASSFSAAPFTPFTGPYVYLPQNTPSSHHSHPSQTTAQIDWQRIEVMKRDIKKMENVMKEEVKSTRRMIEPQREQDEDGNNRETSNNHFSSELRYPPIPQALIMQLGGCGGRRLSAGATTVRKDQQYLSSKKEEEEEKVRDDDADKEGRGDEQPSEEDDSGDENDDEDLKQILTARATSSPQSTNHHTNNTSTTLTTATTNHDVAAPAPPWSSLLHLSLRRYTHSSDYLHTLTSTITLLEVWSVQVNRMIQTGLWKEEGSVRRNEVWKEWCMKENGQKQQQHLLLGTEAAITLPDASSSPATSLTHTLSSLLTLLAHTHALSSCLNSTDAKMRSLTTANSKLLVKDKRSTHEISLLKQIIREATSVEDRPLNVSVIRKVEQVVVRCECEEMEREVKEGERRNRVQMDETGGEQSFTVQQASSSKSHSRSDSFSSTPPPSAVLDSSLQQQYQSPLSSYDLNTTLTSLQHEIWLLRKTLSEERASNQRGEETRQEEKQEWCKKEEEMKEEYEGEINQLSEQLTQYKQLLSQSNSEHESEVLSLKSQITSLTQQVHERDTTLVDLHSKLTAATTQLESSSTSHASEHSSLKDQLSTLTDSLAESQLSSDRLTTDYNKYRYDSQQEIHALKQTLIQYQSLIHSGKVQLSEMRERERDLHAKYDTDSLLKSQKYEREYKRLQEELELLRRGYDKEVSTLESKQKDEKAKLVGEIQQANLDCVIMQKKVNELETSMKDALSEKDTLMSRITQLQCGTELLQNTLAETNNQTLDMLEKEQLVTEKLKEKVQQVEKNEQKIKEKLEQSEKDLSAMKEELTKAQSTSSNAPSAELLHQHSTEIKSLQQQLTSSQLMNEEYEVEKEERGKKLSEVTKELKEVKEQKKSLHTQLYEQQALTKLRAEEYDDLVSSSAAQKQALSQDRSEFQDKIKHFNTHQKQMIGAIQQQYVELKQQQQIVHTASEKIHHELFRRISILEQLQETDYDKLNTNEDELESIKDSLRDVAEDVDSVEQNLKNEMNEPVEKKRVYDSSLKERLEKLKRACEFHEGRLMIDRSGKGVDADEQKDATVSETTNGKSSTIAAASSTTSTTSTALTPRSNKSKNSKRSNIDDFSSSSSSSKARAPSPTMFLVVLKQGEE